MIRSTTATVPPKAVEQTRKLVEQEEVLFISAAGTPTNAAVQKYLNGEVCHSSSSSTGASRWAIPSIFPGRWDGRRPTRAEERVYGKYILKNIPDAKIAVLYQNDDFGKDFLNGFKDGLGEAGAKLIVKEVTYEPADPTIDSQIVSLQSTGATDSSISNGEIRRPGNPQARPISTGGRRIFSTARRPPLPRR